MVGLMWPSRRLWTNAMIRAIFAVAVVTVSWFCRHGITPLQYFQVEYGVGSAPHNPEQVALYPRAEENPFVATHTGRTGGKLPNDIELEAVIIKGACCYASWGYIPVFEGEFE